MFLPHIHTKRSLRDVIEVLDNAKVVIILQYISVSEHYIIHLKFREYEYIFIKFKEDA